MYILIFTETTKKVTKIAKKLVKDIKWTTKNTQFIKNVGESKNKKIIKKQKIFK